ncbi:protein SFI1 homolog [Phaethornis superciliosus]
MHATGQSVTPQSAREVGYTWNQRRLKEFQVRYLARKFFYVWAKKTFGQVLPSKARCFYDQKILQKTFGQWKDLWTVCRERKTSLRAEHHYRHLLYNLVFKAWRAYVCQQQGKRNKYCVAESYAKKQKLLRTWQCWLVYIHVQRTKSGMQSVALAFRERSCLSMWWAVWRRRQHQNCTELRMNVLALQHWAQSLQFRAWLQWRELYLYIQNDKQKATRAVTHHQHWVLKRCMEAWLRYLNLHKAKKHQNEVAQEHHRSRVVQHCFSDWWLSWDCRRRMRAHQEDTEKLAGRIAIQRVFAHWKHYVLCVEETRQHELAENHYNHHLLKLGFKAFCQNVITIHLQQMRKNLAYRQHQVTVLKKFWNCWKSHLEKKEEEQQQALTAVAHARYRRVLMRQVFNTWLLNTCKQQEYRIEEKRAVLHFERQLLHGFWCSWRRRTAACLEEQEGLVRARGHYSNLLLLKAFCLWKRNTNERKTETLKERQALRFHDSKCLQQSWNKWREYVGHQREKWRKLVEADVHYQHALLGKIFAAWKSYQHNIQCIMYQVDEKEKQHTRQLLRQLLCTWRENALALICEAKATSRADEHYRRAILLKVLLQWRCAASLQGYYRQQKITAVMEARKHLDLVCLQNLFLHWRRLTRESLLTRAQQYRAAQHHQQHVLQKYLVKWKKYHQLCLEKMLLQRQGNQLMAYRLCSASFSCWKTQLVQQRWEKQKTMQALWHWSLSLQRKVFDAWLLFAKGKQQKEGDVEKATGLYHATSLRESYAAGMKQLQGQLQAQHQLKCSTILCWQAAHNLHLPVYHCAMLWKQKALSKKLNNPCSFLPPLKKQVTVKMPDVTPETRGHSTEKEPWPSRCNCVPFGLADGNSILQDLNASRQARLPPQRPDFLLESPESKELLGPPFTRSEAPFQQISVKKCSAQTGNLMLAPQLEKSKCLSQSGNTSHSCPSLPSVSLWTHDVHHALQRPELWSPSPFLPQIKAWGEVRGSQPVSGHNGAQCQDSQQESVEKLLQTNLQPRLSSEDLVGERSHQTAAEGEEGEHSFREEIVLQKKLEGELRQIQQQMQYYYSKKQELKSCQQQAQILQKWLENSTQSEDRGGVQELKEELHQMQVRINTLSKAQPRDRQHVQKLLARLQDIQITLET